MKLNAVLLSFYLAPLAWCTPVPIVLVDNLEAVPVSHAAHPQHALAPQINFVNDNRKEITIDNRPITPSATATPSTVLAAPQPVVTSYLLALARLRGFRRRFPAFHVTHEDVAAIEASSIAQMEIGAHAEATDAKAPMPSYYPCAAMEHDMLAISLVAIFLFFVIVVETWATVIRSTRSIFSRRGRIYLDEEVVIRPLSVRADECDAVLAARSEKLAIGC